MRHMIEKYMSLPCRDKGEGVLPPPDRSYGTEGEANAAGRKMREAASQRGKSMLAGAKSNVAIRANSAAGREALKVLVECGGAVYYYEGFSVSLSVAYNQKKPADKERIGNALVTLGCDGFGELEKGTVQAASNNAGTLMAVAQLLKDKGMRFDKASTDLPAKDGRGGRS